MLSPVIATPLASYSCLVPLKDGPPGPALFLVPGLGGTIEGLLFLGELLKVSLPVYAVQAIGVDGREEADRDVGVMTERYLGEIRRLQPTGPYVLCGHSFGGLVAYEMAVRLRAAGEEIAALVLLDTPIHHSFWPRAYFLKVLIERFRHHLATMRRMPKAEIAIYSLHTFKMMMKKILGLFGRVDFAVSDEDDLPPVLQTVLDAGLIAFARYRPPSYPGKLIYLGAEIAGTATLDPKVIWRPRVAGIEMGRAPGAHLSMLEPPYVQELAAEVSACINRAVAPTIARTVTEQGNMVSY